MSDTDGVNPIKISHQWCPAVCSISLVIQKILAGIMADCNSHLFLLHNSLFISIFSGFQFFKLRACCVPYWSSGYRPIWSPEFCQHWCELFDIWTSLSKLLQNLPTFMGLQYRTPDFSMQGLASSDTWSFLSFQILSTLSPVITSHHQCINEVPRNRQYTF